MLMKCMRNLCFEPLKLDVEEELVLRERERERESMRESTCLVP